MTRAPTARLFAPRKLVPNSLSEGRVANLLNMPIEICGACVRRRMMGSKSRAVTVLADVDGGVYVVLRDCETLREVIASHPFLLIGVYGRTATAEDIAEDLQAHCGEMAA